MKKRVLSVMTIIILCINLLGNIVYAENKNGYSTMYFKDAEFKTMTGTETSTEGVEGVGGINNKYLIFRNVEFGNDGIGDVSVNYASMQYSYMHIYAVEAGTARENYVVETGAIEELASSEMVYVYSNATGSWNGSGNNTVAVANGFTYTGTYDIVVSFGEFGNYFSVTFSEGEVMTFSPYEEIKFVDATYTTAGINGGPLVTDLEGNAVTEDYRGLQDMQNKYAAFKDVELNGITDINIVSSVLWNPALATVYILPANTYDLTNLTVTNGKVNDLTEVIGIWNQANDSWDTAQLTSASISQGTAYNGTYDIVIAFNDNAYGANFWYFYFENNVSNAFERTRFIDADYKSASVTLTGGPMEKDTDGSIPQETYYGIGNVGGQYVAFENVEFGNRGVAKIKLAAATSVYNAPIRIYLTDAGETEISELEVENGEINGMTPAATVQTTATGNWGDAVLFTAKLENGDSYTGMYDVIITFPNDIFGNYYWFEFDEIPSYFTDITFDGIDGISEDKNAISPYTNTITIDFGTDMNESTVNETNIYVTKIGENEINTSVSYMAQYSNGKYIMTLADLLEVGEEYKITITSDVKNSNNYGNEEDFVYEFKVSENTVSADKLVYLNENFDVGDISALTGWYISDNAEIQDSSIKVNLASGNGSSHISYDIGEAVDSGKIKIALSVKPGSGGGNTFVELSDSDGRAFPLLFAEWSGTFASGKPFAEAGYNFSKSYALDEWYDVEAIVDLDTRTVSMTLTDKTGEKFVAPNVRLGMSSDNSDIKNIKNLVLKLANNSTTSSYFDNISIERVLDVPYVAADAISIINVAGGEETIYQAIDPAINRISVNFNSYLNNGTINENTFYLKNDETGEKVECIRIYEKGIATLYFADRLLPQTNYTLHIDGSVKNLAEETLGTSFDLSLKTTKGYVKISLEGIKVNNTIVNSISDIQEGDSGIISVDYINSTTDDANLYFVIGYYADNELVDVEYIKKTVDKSIKAQTYTFEHIVKSTEGIDGINIMAWNGFNTMRPISKSISLN